jgi:DNA-binding transcriptional ArsR family regulator
MVNYLQQQHNLDRVFATLADPTRRAILGRLAQVGAERGFAIDLGERRSARARRPWV